jgi:hypothetical protein
VCQCIQFDKSFTDASFKSQSRAGSVSKRFGMERITVSLGEFGLKSCGAI